MAGNANAQGSSAFVGPLHHISMIASTVPGNGDVNPYGVAVIPSSTGDLFQGNILVSNFNDKANVQGTGTTIIEVTPSGKTWAVRHDQPEPARLPRRRGPDHRPDRAAKAAGSSSARCPPRGGSISGPGCLIVLDRWGHVRETFTGHGINGPWDMATDDLGNQAVLFVTNVLNGTVAGHGHTVYGGTVIRLDVTIPSSGLPYIWFANQIGSGFPERLNSAALVIGPTGLGLGADGTLYVADTLDSRIAAIPDALYRADDPRRAGFTVSAHGHLNGELGLVIAPNGDILTVNGGNGNLVEVTPSGAQIAVQQARQPRFPAGRGRPVRPGASCPATTPSTSSTTPPTSWTCSTPDRTRHAVVPLRPAGYSVTPTSTGSGVSDTPNASRTPSLISRARAISPAVVADPELTSASVCLDEIRAPSPRLYPLPNPARSISQAAGTFTSPPPASNLGTAVPAPHLARAAVSTARSAAASSTGLTKNEPTLRVSGSAGSITIPLRRRSSRTAARACSAGTRSPSCDPQGRGQLGVADRRGQRLGWPAGRSRSAPRACAPRPA